MKIADIYDFDGTITKTDTTKIMLFSLFVTNPFSSFMSLFKINIKNKKEIGSIFLKGKKISNITLFIFRFLTKLTIRKWLIRNIQNTEYKKKVIILSASFQPFIENFFDSYYPKLDIDVCATKVIIKKQIVQDVASPNRGELKSTMIKNNYPLYKFDKAWGNELDDLYFLKLAKKQYFIINSNVLLDDQHLKKCSIYNRFGEKIQ